ncbi:hypothetical protein CGK24_11530 [Vibrio parahaemolyticus]|nr:hypothetical protein [Vibrio parahaemolyticus]ETZ11754.1 hypothetical protein AJ90_23745 [Vibrio parahaemolyticus M0605]OEA05341.1 hypothetical protein BBM53_09555 [Vibrio parahaemolyticus]OQU11591.1 hypothetical protein EM64_000930 [Vibrio parahaemolyticus]OUD48114.1 hypothetical protein BS624_06910 [Vibrio parahaemolyticus]
MVFGNSKKNTITILLYHPSLSVIAVINNAEYYKIYYVIYIPVILKLIMKLENKREGNQIWFNFAIKKRHCAKSPPITFLIALLSL